MQVVLAYKNFAANRAISHIGLGVTALNTAKSLRDAGVNADVWPITSAAELRTAPAETPASHVVISAPWIQTNDLAHLCAEFKETQFAVTCHSNLGFLQADPSAMRLVREGLELRRTTWNFRMAANCARLVELGTRGVWNALHASAESVSSRRLAAKARALLRRHAADRRVRRHARA